MKRVLFVLGLVLVLSTGIAWAADEELSGWIADAKCAKNANKAGHAGCAKKCIESGQKAVFVSEDGSQVLEVTNQDVVKPHAGHHVKVSGEVNADAKTITVAKVTMIED